MVLVLYINLARREDRKKSIEEQCSKLGVNPVHIVAVDANEIPKETEETLPFVTHKGYKLWLTQYACALSHLKAMKYLIESGEDKALILEDDAIFKEDAIPYLKFYLGLAPLPDQPPIPSDWKIIALGHLSYNKGEAMKPITKVSLNPYRWWAGAHAYLIKRETAASFIDTYGKTIWAPFDDMLAFVGKFHKTYLCNPPLAYQIEGYSDIDRNHVEGRY